MPVKDTSGDGCRCEPEVVVLGSFPPLKGLSPYCAEFAKALSAKVRLHCLSFKRLYPRFLYPGGDSAEGQGAPEDGELGSRVTRKLTWYNPFGWLAAGLATQGALLHAQWWTVVLAPVYAVICGCFRLRGKPVIITVHNTRFHESSRLADWVGGWVLRLGTRFIVHAEGNATALAERYGIPLKRISVIPHGPLDFFVKPQGDYADVRHRFGIPGGGKVVLLFGAVRPYKGIDTAIHAFAEVAASDPSVYLLIAGRLWEEWQPYQEIVDRHGLAGRVHLHLDYVLTAEVGDYFQAADLVLLPYHSFDSQSGVGSAALAFGKPMLVSDVGGLPELVADRSCVVPPRDVPALAEALRRAFSEPRRLERMREDAQAMAERYSWSGIAEQTRALYEDVLGIRA